jgi:chromate transporter
MGWNVGMNAGGMADRVLGVVLAMVGILMPSTTLTYTGRAVGPPQPRAARGARLQAGHGPIVVALLIATSWMLASANGSSLKVPTGRCGW